MTGSSSESSVIPKTYEELQRFYGAHIHKILNRSNKVEQNFEDLHSYIWMKLLEAEVLERFEEYVLRQIPKVVTGLEACDVLGVSWTQWIAAHKLFHLEGKGHWMPKPINQAAFDAAGDRLGFCSHDALYSLADVLQLTIGEYAEDGALMFPFRKMGRYVVDGVIVKDEERPEGFIKIPIMKATAVQFRNYLTMAVLNHYSNFCRTVTRRHKERPHQKLFPHADDTPTWEASLVDHQNPPQDVVLTLTETKSILDEAIDGYAENGEVVTGEAIFSKIRDGLTLTKALREMKLPPKIRKAILRAIRPFGK